MNSMRMNRMRRLLGLLMIFAGWGFGHTGWAQPTIPKDQIPPDLPPDIRQRLENLYSTEAKTRATAARRLGDPEQRVVPFLIAMLHDDAVLYDKDELLRRALVSSFASDFSHPNTPGEVAARRLALKGPDGAHLGFLIARLKDKDPYVRANVLRALGDMPDVKDGRVVQPLVPALGDKHPTVQQYAAMVLAAQGGLPLGEAVPTLLATLPHGNAEVRAAVADALGRAKDRRAVDPLIRLLADGNEQANVRGSAAGALGAIGDGQAIPALIDAARDEEAGLRGAIAMALAHFKDPRVREPLIAALQDEERAVRETTAGALGWPGHRWAVEPLIAALEDTYPNVRARAAESLGELGDRRALQPILRALKDENSYVRWHASLGLCALKDPRAKEALTEALDDESELVRKSAQKALKAIARHTSI